MYTYVCITGYVLCVLVISMWSGEGGSGGTGQCSCSALSCFVAPLPWSSSRRAALGRLQLRASPDGYLHHNRDRRLGNSSTIPYKHGRVCV